MEIGYGLMIGARYNKNTDIIVHCFIQIVSCRVGFKFYLIIFAFTYHLQKPDMGYVGGCYFY